MPHDKANNRFTGNRGLIEASNWLLFLRAAVWRLASHDAIGHCWLVLLGIVLIVCLLGVGQSCCKLLLRAVTEQKLIGV